MSGERQVQKDYPWRLIRRNTLASFRQRFLGIDENEASFVRRGFDQTNKRSREVLETTGRTFIEGYNLAISIADPELVAIVINATAQEFCGFAFEGAAMGFALLDILSPWSARRFKHFVDGPGNSHIYMGYIGAGWALARTSYRLKWRLGSLDPVLQWLVADGFGFHAGFFHHEAAIDRHERPKALRGYVRNAFDQGLGRSIWFAKGANVAGVSASIASFPERRRCDLWSGAGLAATYAGGAGQSELSDLLGAAGPYRYHLRQGAAFAAKARQRAGNVTGHTAMACRILCGIRVADAAQVTDRALSTLDSNAGMEPFEIWRTNIRAQLADSLGVPQ